MAEQGGEPQEDARLAELDGPSEDPGSGPPSRLSAEAYRDAERLGAQHRPLTTTDVSDTLSVVLAALARVHEPVVQAALGGAFRNFAEHTRQQTDGIYALASRGVGGLNAGSMANLKAAIESVTPDVRPLAITGSLLANLNIGALLGSIAFRPTTTAQLTDQFARQVGARNWLLTSTALNNAVAVPLLATAPLGTYEQMLHRLHRSSVGRRDDDDILRLASTHGDGVTALVARDALVASNDKQLAELTAAVEVEVVEPWRAARARAGEELQAMLAAVDPKLAALFRGSWEAVDREGPGYLESGCHLILEGLQRTLTRLAPEQELRDWAAETGQRWHDLSADGRPTRKARIRYAMRNRSGERKLVAAEVEAVCASVDELAGRLNAGKHASVGSAAVLRANLVSTEAVLLRLLSA